MNQNIPEKYRLNSHIHHDTYLIDGKIGKWNGELLKLYQHCWQTKKMINI